MTRLFCTWQLRRKQFMHISKSLHAFTAITFLLFASMALASNIPWTAPQQHKGPWHAPRCLAQSLHAASIPSWTGFSYPRSNALKARPDLNSSSQKRLHSTGDPSHIPSILGIHHDASATDAPIPMVAWLLGAGIFGLIGFSRKP